MLVPGVAAGAAGVADDAAALGAAASVVTGMFADGLGDASGVALGAVDVLTAGAGELVAAVTAAPATGDALGTVAGEAEGAGALTTSGVQGAWLVVSSPLPNTFACTAKATLEMERTIASAMARARVQVPSVVSLRPEGSRQVLLSSSSFLFACRRYAWLEAGLVDRPPAEARVR